MHDIDNLLTIVGTFGTIALGINAYFLKGIYSEVNDVKIKMTEIFVESKHSREEIDLLRDRYHKILNEVQKNSLRIHKIEQDKK